MFVAVPVSSLCVCLFGFVSVVVCLCVLVFACMELYTLLYVVYCMCLYVRLHVCDFLSAYSISVSLGLYINLERWAKRQGQAVVETETGTQVLVGCDYCTPGLNPVCTVVEGAGDKRVLRETEVECVRLH